MYNGKVAIAISGLIASGKTTIAHKLADKLNAKYGSFGKTLRAIAIAQGLKNERHVLQRLGEEWIERRCAKFCELTLAEANWTSQDSLVIEGLRHVQALEALKHLLRPIKLILVYIDADDTLRAKRLMDAGLDSQELKRLDSHSTEIQVQSVLKQMADYVVISNESPENIVSNIILYIDSIENTQQNNT